MVGAAYAISVTAALIGARLSVVNVVAALAFSALSTLVLLLIARPVGRVIETIWRKQGGALQRTVLRVAARRYGAASIVITGRRDRADRAWRRVLETTALVAGVDALAVTAARLFIPAAGAAGLGLAFVLAAFALTFVVTPLWAFNRLGLRRIDGDAFVVAPLSREYGRRTRLADGAFFLVALTGAAAMLRKAGDADADAYREVALIALNLAGFAVLVLSHAVRLHAKHVDAADAALAAEAKALGCIDARGATSEELRALVI